MSKTFTYKLDKPFIYEKGKIIGKYDTESDKVVEDTDEYSKGKIVILDKFQKFRKLKQGMVIEEGCIIKLHHKPKFCVAEIVKGRFINNKEKIGDIR